jgi:hypothetical protein
MRDTGFEIRDTGYGIRDTAALAAACLAGAALSCAGAAGGSVAAQPSPAAAEARTRAEPVRPVRHLPRLRANIANAERYVVKDVCEREGIRQIARILQRHDFEEMWAFLPRAHGARDCQWHEIGRGEKSDRHGSYLRVDMGYLAELMAANTEIHLVHFHPRKYFECASRGDCPKRTAGRSAAPDERWVTDLVFSMPSPSDVHFMMEATSRFFRRHEGRGTIRHSVVTPYGVVDYGLTEQGLAKYEAERNGRSEGLYITWVMAGALDSERVAQVVTENPGSLGAAVPRLARTLNTEFLRLAHRQN